MKIKGGIWISLLAACTVVIMTNSTKAADMLVPPMDAVGEIPITDETKFISACMSKLMGNSVYQTWVYSSPFLTKSEIWGKVVRIDYTLPDEENLQWKNRVVCWQLPSEEEIRIGFFFALPATRSYLGQSNQDVR